MSSEAQKVGFLVASIGPIRLAMIQCQSRRATCRLGECMCSGEWSTNITFYDYLRVPGTWTLASVSLVSVGAAKALPRCGSLAQMPLLFEAGFTSEDTITHLGIAIPGQQAHRRVSIAAMLFRPPRQGTINPTQLGSCRFVTDTRCVTHVSCITIHVASWSCIIITIINKSTMELHIPCTHTILVNATNKGRTYT